MEIRINGVDDLPEDFEIACPDCGTQLRFKFVDVKPGVRKECSECGAGFTFSGDDLTALGRAVADLKKALKKKGWEPGRA